MYHRYKNNCILYTFLHDHTIVVTNLKDLENILTNAKLTEKSVEYTFLINWIGKYTEICYNINYIIIYCVYQGTGLLIATGKKWFTRRKILTPSFHFKILESYVDVFNKQSSVFVRKLKKHVNGKEFDVYPMAALAALDVICGKFIYHYNEVTAQLISIVHY